MTQLAIIVISIGLGNLVAFLTSLKLIPTTVGYIIRKRRTPIGIDIWPNFNESKYCPNWGKNLPKSKPMTMQMAIHNVRYFSKSPSETSSDLLDEDVIYHDFLLMIWTLIREIPNISKYLNLLISTIKP
jgi:hypothetical protein